MPTVKSPEERGPLGAWAYESRTSLDLSPEAVVHALGKYNAATIRKAEASSKDMSMPLWRALVALYSRLATGKGVTLSPIPLSGTPPTAATDQSAVVAAIDRQTAVIAQLVEQLRAVVVLNVDLSQDVAKVVGRLTGSPIPGEDPSATPEPEHSAGTQGVPQRSAGTK